MEKRRVDSHGGVPWKQAIYQTRELTNANGRAPERVVARQLSSTLDDLGVDHEIYYDFPPVQSDSQTPTCPTDASDRALPERVDVGEGFVSDPPDAPRPVAGTAIDALRDTLGREGTVAALDSNLMLTAQVGGGGCGTIGGNVSTAGAGATAPDPGNVLIRGHDAIHDDISSALHEIGHNMGNTHAEMAGTAWNGDQYWHYTPSASTLGFVPGGVDENLCGEPIPDRQRQDYIRELYFHDCQATHMAVEPKAPLVSGRQGGPATADFRATVDRLVVNFDATHTHGGFAITDYRWDFGDGTAGTGAKPIHVYDSPGRYDVTLTVDGYDGTSDTATAQVAVGDAGDSGGGGQIGAEELAAAGGLAVLFALAVPEETRDQWIDRLTGQ